VYPAEIPVHICAAVLRNAEIAHDVAGCRTLSRSDFIYDTIRDKAFFLEINTHPGFTELSLVPEIAAHNGITFSQLVEILVADGLNSQHFDSYQKHHNNSNYCVV
jgi:D-alanine-D-alanine ligase